MTDLMQQLLELEAEELAKAHPDTVPLGHDNEFVGLAGQAEFARLYRQPLNLDRLGGRGDGGRDFIVPLAFTVDIKTARTPKYLIAPPGSVKADIYVLLPYSDRLRKAGEPLGWEWGMVLRRAPIADFGYGPNHYIPGDELRKMSELDKRIMRLVVNAKGGGK